MKALVTGCAGFIGSHVAEHLLKAGYEVIGIDDLSGGFFENIPEGTIFHKVSICNHHYIDALFKNIKFDYVFHLAAYAAENLSHFIRRYNYENNLMGSVNLINASIKHKVKCFVFTSSSAVYGHSDMVEIPIDPYGISKLAVEQDLQAAYDMFSLNYIIFRPHNVYGERQNIGDKYRNVIGVFMNQILQEQPIMIFGDGKQTRAFTYIDDVAPFIAESIENKDLYGDVYNIGSDDFASINEIADMVNSIMGNFDLNIKYLEARKEALNVNPSHSLLKVLCNYKAKTSIEEGIKKMAVWVKKHGARKSKDFEEIEITENLPEGW